MVKDSLSVSYYSAKKYLLVWIEGETPNNNKPLWTGHRQSSFIWMLSKCLLEFLINFEIHLKVLCEGLIQVPV